MLNIPSGTKITITGDLGSGKSAVSKILCERTGFEYISTGRVQRQLAQELGIDTLEMNRLADTDPTIDERIDGIFVTLGKDPNGYIIDSRMAWFFLPNSFKIFLQTDVEVAVQRIMNDPNRDSEQYSSPDEAAQKILARKASENARFLAKYGADCANLNNFDLVINTANRTQAQVAEVIFEVLEGRQEGREMKRFW
ncbi:MAG TPA: cytidylate kinase family protein [Saprospiraceae bacterium]|nr:cytidylate kinase family protein [Saprospiraceae bacterium]